MESHGVSSVVSSNILTLLQLSGLPCSFIVPLLASKMNGRRFLDTFLIIGYVFGPLMFLLNIQSTWLLVIISFLTGFGSGIAFNEAIYFFTNKTTNPYQTAEVSGMAQSAGYLLAAFGPVIFGYIHDLANTWSLTMVILTLLSVVLVITGITINHHKPIAE